jgi:hypothetical protein
MSLPLLSFYLTGIEGKLNVFRVFVIMQAPPTGEMTQISLYRYRAVKTVDSAEFKLAEQGGTALHVGINPADQRTRSHVMRGDSHHIRIIHIVSNV